MRNDGSHSSTQSASSNSASFAFFCIVTSVIIINYNLMFISDVLLCIFRRNQNNQDIMMSFCEGTSTAVRKELFVSDEEDNAGPETKTRKLTRSVTSL